MGASFRPRDADDADQDAVWAALEAAQLADFVSELRGSKDFNATVAKQFGNLPKDVPGGAIKWRRVEVRPL